MRWRNSERSSLLSTILSLTSSTGIHPRHRIKRRYIPQRRASCPRSNNRFTTLRNLIRRLSPFRSELQTKCTSPHPPPSLPLISHYTGPTIRRPHVQIRPSKSRNRISQHRHRIRVRPSLPHTPHLLITSLTPTSSCLPHCKCKWRELLDKKLIYSIYDPVHSAEPIYHAIKDYSLRGNNIDERWKGWSEYDAKNLIAVIEKVRPFFFQRLSTDTKSSLQIIAAYKSAGTISEVILTSRSWIRKIVRQTGVLPPSFVLTGVVQVSEHPVSGGGFADIFTGKLEMQKVALKVLRVFVTEENRKKIHRVCPSHLYLGRNRLILL